MSKFYAKALQYHTQGYSILPLKKDKRPLIAEWIDLQNTPATLDIIEGWWEKTPDANIGIITGKISGVTVVDIDTKGETVVDWKQFPATFTVKTPSGGYHLYYQYDATIKQTANTYPQFPHVDIRNDGGYVVAAGSVTNYIGKDGELAGGEYVVEVAMEPTVFPRAMFEAGEKKRKKPASLLKKINQAQSLKDGDGRNNHLCSLLGTMLRGQPANKYPEVKGAFMAVAEAMNDPLGADELETIWESIAGRAVEEAPEIQFYVNGKGTPYVNLENVSKILLEDDQFARRCIYDEFLQVYLYRDPVQNAYRELHDSDEITLTREISVKYPSFSMVAPSTVRAALLEQARNLAVDSAKDYIRGITWDGVSRLDTWLSETYNVAKDEYHKTVGSNWFKGMARRIIEPGCKFDYVLVLEGPQGTKKSTSLGIIGGAWHVETTAAPDSKDFLMLLQGNLIIEFSEGETLSRGEIKQLKAVITTQNDKYRSPYERHVQTHPRRCVFAMTTNQTEYLKDETGNRRWLPVATQGEANIEWLRTNRDQLFAEALYRVETLKETTYEFSEDVMEQQARRQVTDPNEDRIVEWYMTLDERQKKSGVTSEMAFRSALVQIGAKFRKSDEVEIANIFKKALGLEKKQVMVDGHRFMRWFPAGVLTKSEEVMTREQQDMAF